MNIYCYYCGVKTQEGEAGRAVCAEHGILRKLYRNALCADAFIVRDGHVLLVKRAREPFAGMWAMPGGFQELGEHPSATAVREAKEETGIDIQLVNLLGVYVERMSDDDFRQVTVFIADCAPGSVPHSGDDASACKWFALDGLPDSLLPFHRQRIVDFHNRVFSVAVRTLR